jgi:hypothetical protein
MRGDVCFLIVWSLPAGAHCPQRAACATPGPQNLLAFGLAEGARRNMWNLIDPARQSLGYYPNAKQAVRFWAWRRHRSEGTSMDDKWRVSPVELLEGGLLFGFLLYDQKGRPCVSFGYGDRSKARLGRNHVAAALKDAEQVLGR